MISEFLFFEDDAPKDEKSSYVNLKIEIRELIKDRLHRKVLTEILLDLRKDVSGETQNRLFRLYQDLGLHKDAFKKLKSWRWHIISKGIYELAQMQVAESYGFIKKFINDKRGTIRKQAEIAIITLNKDGLNYFLDTTEYRISEWQQLKLLDVIRNQDDFDPPRFKAWLISSNKHVVLFALRLIKYYNQNDAFASITELVKHRNDQIKKEAISCIKEFNVVEALPTLKPVFWKSSVTIKITILDAIAELGSTDDLEFLRLIDHKESNFSVRSKALSSINAIAPETVIPTRGIMHVKGNQIPKDIKVKELDDQEHQIEQVVEEVLEEPSITVELNPLSPIKDIGQPTITNEEATAHTDIDEKGESPEIEPSKAAFNLEELEQPVTEDASEGDNNISEIQRQDLEEEDEQFEIGELEEAEVLQEKISLTTISLDFLPIVANVDEIHDSINKNDDAIQHPEENALDATILAMEVEYELVRPTSVENTPVRDEKEVLVNDDLDGIELSFLPLVVQNPTKGAKQEVQDQELTEPNNKEMLENEDMDIDFGFNGEEAPVFDFLPLVTENEDVSVTDTPSIDEIKDIEVQMEVVDDKELSRETEEAEDNENKNVSNEWPMEENDSHITSVMKFVSFDSEGDDANDESNDICQETLDILSNLPKPKYYDGETMITMRLLDDIKEFGDQREIPLLKELLSKSNHEVINYRIEEIMQEFMTQGPKTLIKENIASIKEEFKPFSVFEDLFRTCDTEAKLILLDEIVAVGDEKELGFLMDLTTDPNKELREKAIKVLEELDNRLFQENLSFDLSETFITDGPNPNTQQRKNQNTLLGQLLSFPTKIIEKING